MAKKELKTFRASINKNREKGGAWLCTLSVQNELGTVDMLETTAWSNASAAKRHAKARVKELTPRKSMSFVGSALDEKEKPTAFSGTIQYRITI